MIDTDVMEMYYRLEREISDPTIDNTKCIVCCPNANTVRVYNPKKKEREVALTQQPNKMG